MEGPVPSYECVPVIELPNESFASASHVRDNSCSTSLALSNWASGQLGVNRIGGDLSDLAYKQGAKFSEPSLGARGLLFFCASLRGLFFPSLSEMCLTFAT